MYRRVEFSVTYQSQIFDTQILRDVQNTRFVTKAVKRNNQNSRIIDRNGAITRFTDNTVQGEAIIIHTEEVNLLQNLLTTIENVENAQVSLLDLPPKTLEKYTLYSALTTFSLVVVGIFLHNASGLHEPIEYFHELVIASGFGAGGFFIELLIVRKERNK